MVYEAQALFGSVLAASGYLVFRVLDAGMLGKLSTRYFEWVGRVEEQRKLTLALNAEKATLHLKGPAIEREAKDKFEDHIGKVPIDEATGEAIIEGPLYLAWVNEAKKLLVERTCEAIVSYRMVDTYFKDTFCKMSQGLASNRAWKDAEVLRQSCDLELQDICEWAKRLKPGWEGRILQECSRLVDENTKRNMESQARDEQRHHKEQQERLKANIQARIQASEKRYQAKESAGVEESAKSAEELLLSEEAEEKSKKKKGKKSAA